IVHPRVEIRRARDWDKRGDAGAFAWAGDDDQPGYRVIASDRLVYPPGFAATMAVRLAAYGDRAVVGLGGTLLRQPVAALDDPGSATAIVAEAALPEDRTVHLLDLDAVAYRGGAVALRPGEFAYRGLASLWLARHAQRHGVPLIAASRPAGWVRRRDAPAVAHERLPADAAAVAAATLRRLAPVTLQPSGRSKAAVVVAMTSAHDLEGFLGDWQAARAADIDWVLVLAVAAEAVAAARTVLADLDPFHEVHLVVATPDRPALRAAMALLGRLGCDAALVTSDQVRFKSRGALAGLVATLAREPDAILAVPPPPAAPGAAAGGPLMIACGRAAVAGLPPVDARPPAHLVFADWAARAAALGRPLGLASGDALVSSHVDPAVGDALAAWQADSGPPAPEPAAPALVRRAAGSSINALFERVVVLNLDRQADRWEAAKARLARAGIAAERFRAVDPAWPETMRDYIAYAGSAPVAPPPALRAVASPLAFYKDYDSQTARVGHLEHRDGRKAIASPAQWAALYSHIAVIEKAMADGVGSLLVLDDGVVFHRDAQAVVAAAAASLPDDWMVLQLGTRLDRWDPAWVTWRSPHLYSAGGAVGGAYALGLRFDAYASLLDHARRRELPFDLGALATVTRDFAERCFVVSPHVAIVPPAAGEAEATGDDRGGYDFGARAAEPGEPFPA
ncbi:MAG TPA: hypothetical protein VHD15_13270, partial [Hyphomicrobiales bacterium]|nr:hypothetical protein [Hyphomicrobiales bacterium]